MLKQRTRDRLNNGINAGSMADIAFLLLIFFLVTTTIADDKGILVKMPPWVPNQQPTDIMSRNVCQVWINQNNELLVRGAPSDISALKEKVKAFIMNPNQSKEMAKSPNKAVVSLKNDRGTRYQSYIDVYHEIKAAYNELWNEASQKMFNIEYEYCTKEQRKAVRSKIPLVISEAEPSRFGVEN